MMRSLAFLFLTLSLALTACGGGGGASGGGGGGGGNADRGKTLFTEKQCITCHKVPGIAAATGVIGPDLAGIGTRAATQKPNTTAEAYLRESLKEPNAFVVPGQQSPSLMVLPVPVSDAEITDLVAFLLTVR
jgi:cytochrome c2